MGGSSTALIVAVVGVLGTLFSGLLVQRGALRAKRVELAHSEREREQERRDRERTAEREARRQAYVALNQRARDYHWELWQWFGALAEPATRAGDAADRAAAVAAAREAATAARGALSAAYAEAQLVVADDVLAAAGRLVHLLYRLGQELDRPTASEPAEADGLRRLLTEGSERLYEVRQVMRRDLGISDLPIARPPDHGRE